VRDIGEIDSLKEWKIWSKRRDWVEKEWQCLAQSCSKECMSRNQGLERTRDTDPDLKSGDEE
jgi:hypothetical protein